MHLDLKKVAVAAGLLAVAVLLGWQFGRQPAPSAVAPPPDPVTRADAPAAPPAPTPLDAVGGDEARPIPTRDCAVDGHVKRADTAAPVTAFELAVLPEVPTGSGNWMRDERIEWQARESADGSFTVDCPGGSARFVLAVRADGFEPAVQSVDGADTRVVVLLTAQPGIAGTVESAQGRPIADAAIRVGEGAAADIVARTGRDGRFRVSGLKGGEILLTAEHPDYVSSLVRVPFVGTGVAEVTVVLTGGGTIEGAVSKGGRPLPGARVLIYDAATVLKTALSDGVGRYRINGLRAGDVQVECQMRIEGLAVPVSRQRLALVQENSVTSVDFEFPEDAGSIGGLVTVNGEPASGGIVEISSAGKEGESFVSAPIGKDGIYRVDYAPPGELWMEVTAESASGVKHARQVVLTLNSGERIERDIELGGHGAIEGSIENAAAGVAYRVLLFPGEVDAAAVRSSRETAVASLAADDAGRFRIDGITGGVYTVFVIALSPDAEQTPAAYAQAKAAFRILTVQDGETATVSLSF